MDFGLNKCEKSTFKREKLPVETMDIKIDLDTTIKELELEGSFKYIGIRETKYSTPWWKKRPGKSINKEFAWLSKRNA